VEILERLEVGWGKVMCWSTKAATSLERVEIEEKLLWRAYRWGEAVRGRDGKGTNFWAWNGDGDKVLSPCRRNMIILALPAGFCHQRTIDVVALPRVRLTS